MTATKAVAKIDNSSAVAFEFFGDKVIDEFIASRHASANTMRTYHNAVKQLRKFFAAKAITAPTTADVDAFINELRTAKKSNSTLKLYFATTKLFFSFLAQRGYYSDVAADAAPLKLRKSSTHKKAALSTAQAKKLLAAVEGDSRISKRDKSVVALALTSGLRCCEISRADVGDFYCDCGDYFLRVQGKGRLSKDEVVRVPNATAELILAYLKMRGNVSDDSPLFVSESNQNHGARFSVQSVGKMITRHMKAAGVHSKNTVTPHSTRHFAATTAIEAGVDIRQVSQMLRHSNLSVTVVYLHDLSVRTRRAEICVANALFAA